MVQGRKSVTVTAKTAGEAPGKHRESTGNAAGTQPPDPPGGTQGSFYTPLEPYSETLLGKNRFAKLRFWQSPLRPDARGDLHCSGW